MAEHNIDDFVWVLAIALILLIVAGVFSYFVPYTGPLTNITISSFSPGQVGQVENYVSKSIDLRTFTVGEPQTEPLRAWPQLELSASWFGGRGEEADIGVPGYLLETARGVRITFDLYDTNNYGNLVMKWNGREVLNQALQPRQHEVFIDRADVRGSNSLEVYTTGPGMLFWATSMYVIKNFNVNLEYGPQRLIPFEMLPSEMEQFDRVELSAYASGTGTLAVKINGVQVYSDSPQGVVTEEFTLFDAPVRPGQNILTLSDETGTYTLRDAMFRIYLAGESSRASHGFNLTDEHYGFLVQGIFKGKVDYRVENIARQGSVDIAVNGHQLSTPVPSVGWNSAYFTANLVSPGDNQVVFSGTGSFDIPEAVVGLER
jgi:hypothetical protein